MISAVYTRLGGAGLVMNPRKLIRWAVRRQDGSGVNSGLSHVNTLRGLMGIRELRLRWVHYSKFSLLLDQGDC